MGIIPRSPVLILLPGVAAVLKIKEDGVLAGMEVAEKIFRFKELYHIYPFQKRRGANEYGEKVAEAHVHTILQCERLVLNCMQRMSGIATLTRIQSCIEAIKQNCSIPEKQLPISCQTSTEQTRIHEENHYHTHTSMPSPKYEIILTTSCCYTSKAEDKKAQQV